MYFIYFLLIMTLLQGILFRFPLLLVIAMVLYAGYSYVHYRQTRQSAYSPYQGQSDTSQSSSARTRSDDVIDVEYTEHEL